jgi:hypothetical protein
MAGYRLRSARVIAGAAGLLVLLSACSIPSRPVWWPKPKHTVESAADSAASGHGKATSKSGVPVVARPWRNGIRQLGIQVYWTANIADSDAVVRAKARRIINYAISLNSNSIAVTFPFYTHGITADTVHTSPATTPSPEHIAIFLAEAAKSHIRVTLRPILNENALVAENPLAWRGTIAPTDRHAWFQSYQDLLMPYAQAAQAGGAATFVVGTELASLQGDPNWPGLIKAIRSVYRGQLLYDENFDEFAAHDTDLPLATFGVDAYPRFTLSDGATVAQLANAWEAWLGTHTAAIRNRAVLSEVGIDAVAGSYSDPGAWLSTTRSPIDLPIQTNWYDAVCRAVSTEQIGGIYWWEVNFDASPADPGPYQSDRLTFLGRPAQQVIRSCFADLATEILRPS